MPRFYFHVHDGVSELDREGTELPDWEEARLEAIRQTGAILRDEAWHIALGEDWRMEVTDERGLLLFRLDFTVVASPTLTHSRRTPSGRKTPEGEA
jgi:hypothetical protein